MRSGNFHPTQPFVAAPGPLTPLDSRLLVPLCAALAYADEVNEPIDTTVPQPNPRPTPMQCQPDRLVLDLLHEPLLLSQWARFASSELPFFPRRVHCSGARIERADSSNTCGRHCACYRYNSYIYKIISVGHIAGMYFVRHEQRWIFKHMFGT